MGSDKQYARIDMDPETLQCPFMEEKLCSVQRELGEDRLSDTCATYPRTHSVMGEIHEQSLTLSCPEAARLALLHEDALDFVESEIQVRKSMVTVLGSKHGISNELMSSIRVFCIGLVKNRDLVLWQRLAVLAIFCESLTQAIKDSRHSEIESLLEQTNSMLEGGQIQQALEPLLADYHVQASIFAELWKLKLGRRISKSQEIIQKNIGIGLGIDGDSEIIQVVTVVEHYKKGIDNLPEVFSKTPFLLENYILNEMFRQSFPFGEDFPDEHFLKLVTRFGIIRFMLALQSTDETNLPEPADVARTIQVFSRLYQHDATYANLVNSALKNTGWSSLEKLFRFLRY